SNVLGAGGERRADRMHTRYELAVLAEPVDDRAAHASHDPHARRYIGGISDLYADLSDVRTDWTHGEGHDVHRAAAHASAKQSVERAAHLARVDPIVRRAGVFLGGAANERAFFHARHVARVRAREERVRAQLRIEANEGSLRHQLVAESVVLS